jgi:hypothetical protein
MAESPPRRRTDRLRQRRAARSQRAMTWGLYVLAAVVALAAVLGASLLARHFVSHKAKKVDRGYTALLTIGSGENGHLPVSYLVVKNRALAQTFVFAAPRSLLLTNPQGVYVMAGDLMGSAALADEVGRLVNARIDFEVKIDYAHFVKLVPAGDLPVIVAQPATVVLNGALRTYKNRFSMPVSDVATVLSAAGKTGQDEAVLEVGIMSAALQTSALLPAGERATNVAAAVAGLSGRAHDKAVQMLRDLTAGSVQVATIPSTGSVAEGQFAFRPDRQQIMALITRRTPGFQGHYTVMVRNGNGEIGIGDLVARRLASLDVTLTPPANADAFDYKQTQIITGSAAAALGEDIRAILGRGVVLAGKDLPATTVVVIVGKDISAKDLQ